MRIFVDECVPKPTRIFLRKSHHELITVEALGRSSAPNGEILSLAKMQRVVLVTIDRGLGDLRRYPLGTHGGIIVLRVRLDRPANVTSVHRNLLTAWKTIAPDHLTGALLIVDWNKYRLRRPT